MTLSRSPQKTAISGRVGSFSRPRKKLQRSALVAM
jgi:hypothetical protein